VVYDLTSLAFSEIEFSDELVYSWTFVGLLSVLLIVGSIIDVILIVGVLKEWTKYILSYVIFACIQLAFIFIQFVFDWMNVSGVPGKTVDVVFLIVAPLVIIYFMICVYSYYVEVKKRQKERRETVQLEMKV
jgi:hypothetical protein